VIIDNRHREFTVDDIAAGEMDATFVGYWAWDALFGTLAPDERITWRVDDIGAPPYHSYLLGTHEAELERDPALVREFLAVTARGYLAAAAEPTAALAAIERSIPYFPRSILSRSLELITPSWFHAGRWGEQRDTLHAPYAAWLQVHGILRSPSLWRGAIRGEFLPSVHRAA